MTDADLAVAKPRPPRADPSVVSGHRAPDLPTPPTAEYNAFVRDAELTAVELQKVSAERLSAGVVDDVDLTTTPEYVIGANRVFYRFDAVAVLRDSLGTEIGRVTAVLALAFSFGADTPSPDVAGRFGLTTAQLLAHPYLREAIQSLGARVGLRDVTLPLIPFSR